MLNTKLPLKNILLSIIICTNTILSQTETNHINNLSIKPDHIEVGAFYNGTQVKVNAEVTGCSGVVVKLTGDDESIVLNKKERKALFWLNVAKDTVIHAPSIYILACTNNLNKLCTREDLEKEMLGYESLKGIIEFRSNLPLTGEEFSEFINLKEHKGCYNINNNAVIKSDAGGKQVLQAYLDIPSFIPVGEYEIVVYCFQNGKLADKSFAALSVKKTGLPLFVSNLAIEHAPLYGILAIIVAMSAGVLIGMIFTKKRHN